MDLWEGKSVEDTKISHIIKIPMIHENFWICNQLQWGTWWTYSANNCQPSPAKHKLAGENFTIQVAAKNNELIT